MNRTRVRFWALYAAGGAVLGALTFVLARTLGFFLVLHLSGYELFWPAVALAAVLFATPLRPLVWGAATFLVVLLVLVAYTPVVTGPARSLIRSDPVTPPVDAVVVLAAGINDDARIAPEAVDRLLSAIALSRDPRIRPSSGEGGPGAAEERLPLVATLVAQRVGNGRTSREDVRNIVALAGDRIELRLTETVRSTRDEARSVAAMARAEGWERVAVVTSPLHTRRACRAFERLGVAVVCVPSEARDFAVHTMRRPPDRVRAFRLWLYETIGTVYYRVRGWL